MYYLLISSEASFQVFVVAVFFFVCNAFECDNGRQFYLFPSAAASFQVFLQFCTALLQTLFPINAMIAEAYSDAQILEWDEFVGSK